MAFNALPIELNENIASYLANDKDLCRFTLICRQTYSAVHTFRAGLWRQRFASCYDLPPGKMGGELKHTYMFRRSTLRRDVHFLTGEKHEELWALEVIRDLVVESFAGTTANLLSGPISNNLAVLRRYVQKTDLLKNVLRLNCKGTTTSPLLQTLQLLFFHWSLEFYLDCPTFAFPCSQQAVYGHPSAFPMFLDTSMCNVNIPLLLHMANFFKYHMTREEEATLFHLFSELEEYEKPRPWQGKITQGVRKLGRLWKGSYCKASYLEGSPASVSPLTHQFPAYLHDLADVPSIRTADPGAEIFTDSIDYEDGFQTLDIDFTPANCPAWPEAFDCHLHSMPPEPLVRLLNNPSPGLKPSKRFSKNIQGPATTSHQRTNALHSSSPTIPTSASASTKEPSYAKKGIHYLPFTGTGHDAEPFHCSGILHPLPPQHGIPGWQRVTMMKYFDALSSSASSTASQAGTPPPPHATSDASPHATANPPPQAPATPSPLATAHPFVFSGFHEDVDLGENVEVEYHDIDIGSGCWAYEGVVLPGGMLMLGRWWSPMDEHEARTCTGPFVFWGVEDRVEGPGLAEVAD